MSEEKYYLLVVTEDGDECDHEGATWSGISILDPLTVEVVPVPLGEKVVCPHLSGPGGHR